MRQILVMIGCAVLAIACVKSRPKGGTHRSVRTQRGGNLSECSGSGHRGACGCKSTHIKRAMGGRPDIAADQVVAQVGAKRITYEEVVKGVQLELIQAETSYLRNRHDKEMESLNNLVSRALLEMAAREKGMDAKVYVKKHLLDKVSEPTKKEVEDKFEALKKENPLFALLNKEKFAQYRERMKFQLKMERISKLREAMLGRLKKRYKIKRSLPAPRMPRIKVDDGGNPSRGPANAPVTIVVFSDFHCGYCKMGAEVLEKIVAHFGPKVRAVHRDYALSDDAARMLPHEATGCAAEQGKFWPYHDHVFKNQSAMAEKDLIAYAGKVKLDVAKFTSCLKSGRRKAEIRKDIAAAKKLGLTGTPAFFVNGIFLPGYLPFEKFKSLVERVLKEKKSGN